ncbi:MAG: hypothetical protein RIS54_730 [Verrucomicrobiota bacterium]|jgi:hypothetical protein
MPALTLAPVLSFFTAFQRVHPSVPLRTLLRTLESALPLWFPRGRLETIADELAQIARFTTD